MSVDTALYYGSTRPIEEFEVKGSRIKKCRRGHTIDPGLEGKFCPKCGKEFYEEVKYDFSSLSVEFQKEYEENEDLLYDDYKISGYVGLRKLEGRVFLGVSFGYLSPAVGLKTVVSNPEIFENVQKELKTLFPDWDVPTLYSKNNC